MQLLDLPRDPRGQLTAIRRPLVSILNSAKHSPTKTVLLKATLEYALAELAKDAPDVPVEVETVVEPIVEAIVEPKKKRATAKVKKDEVTK